MHFRAICDSNNFLSISHDVLGGDSCDHAELMKCLFEGASEVLKRNGIENGDMLNQIMATALGPEDVRLCQYFSNVIDQEMSSYTSFDV